MWLNSPTVQRERLDGAEREQVAAEFQDLANGLFLQYADKVKVYDHTVYLDSKQAHLSLNVPFDDSSSLSVGVHSLSKDSGMDKLDITLQEIGSDGYGHRFSRYHIETGNNEDEIVRRYDNNNVDLSDKSLQFKSQSEYESEESEDPATLLERSEKYIVHLKNEIQNDALEREMGLNDQPIGVDELGKLTDLLTQAVPAKY